MLFLLLSAFVGASEPKQSVQELSELQAQQCQIIQVVTTLNKVIADTDKKISTAESAGQSTEDLPARKLLLENEKARLELNLELIEYILETRMKMRPPRPDLEDCIERYPPPKPKAEHRNTVP